MIPSLEEWLDGKEFAGYDFRPPVYFDRRTQVAITLVLPDGRNYAVCARVSDFNYDRAAATRDMKRQLVVWAKSRGY